MSKDYWKITNYWILIDSIRIVIKIQLMKYKGNM